MATQVIGQVVGPAGFSPVVDLKKEEGSLTITVTNESGTQSETIETGEPVQSNWAINDPTSLAYILNKPSLGTVATTNSYYDLDDKPTKLSQFTNDSQFITSDAIPTKLSEFIGDTTHRLVTDEEKATWSGKQDVITFNTAYDSSTNKAATMSDINSAISGVVQFDYEIVSELPTTGVKGKIYLMLNTGTGTNIYDEYIYINSKFELMGTTQIDISGKADKATTLAGYGIEDAYTQTEVDNKIKALDADEVGEDGEYISSVLEKDGIVTATATTLATAPASGSKVPITAGGVFSALGGSVGIKFLTTAEYNALPSTKLTDGIYYFLTD